MSAFANGKTGLAYARLWHLVDAKGQVVGHLSKGLATVLSGKHKPIFHPSVDAGDYIVVINAKHVAVSGDKFNNKIYKHHTGYPGGLKEIPFSRMIEKKPEEIIRRAVYGMLPKDKLRRNRIERLLIFPENHHPYGANIAKYWEDTELQKLTPKEWMDRTPDELLEQQRAAIDAILKKHNIA